MLNIETINDKKQKFIFTRAIFKDDIPSFLNVIGHKKFEYLVEYGENEISINGNTYKVLTDYSYTYKIYKRTKEIKAIDGLAGFKKFLNDTFWESRITTIFEEITKTNIRGKKNENKTN